MDRQSTAIFACRWNKVALESRSFVELRTAECETETNMSSECSTPALHAWVAARFKMESTKTSEMYSIAL